MQSSTRPEAPRSGLLRRVSARGAWAWLLALLAVVAVAVVQLADVASSAAFVSTGSYIVRPRADDDVSSIDATANLNGAVRVDNTFAQIVESDLVVDRAWEVVRTAMPSAEGATADVDASVAAGANILSIAVRSADAEIATALSQAVGAEAVSYIGDVDLYDLAVLDPPSPARRASRTSLDPSALLAAGVIGLGVGAATSPAARRRFSAHHAGDAARLDTGISNSAYTRERIREERSRTDDNGVPFDLLVLHTELPGHRSSRRTSFQRARAVSSRLRPEDRLGLLDGRKPETFVVIAPGRTNEEAKELALRLQADLTGRLGRKRGPRVVATSYICRYAGKVFHGDPEAILIAEMLHPQPPCGRDLSHLKVRSQGVPRLSESPTDRGDAGSADHQGPVFLGGIAGTGKTRLGSLLGRHSRLAVTRKTYLWRDVYGRHGDLAKPGNLERCIAATFAIPGVRALNVDPSQVAREMAERAPTYAALFDVIHGLHARSLGKARWCNQLGLVEAYAEPIFAAFPNSRFIHMVVDPRRSPSVNRAAGVSGWALGKWLTSMELASHNRALFGDRYLILKQEDLAADEPSVLSEACSFLGETLEPSMSDPPESPARPSPHSSRTGNAHFVAATAGPVMADSGYDTTPAGPLGWLPSALVGWPVNRLALAAWRRIGMRSIVKQIGAGP